MLYVPHDPMHDPVAKITELRERCAHVLEKRGMIGGRQWASGAENGVYLIRREL